MRFFVIIILCIFFASCENPSQKAKMKINANDSSEKMALYSPENLRINVAIATARKTYPDFLNLLRNGCKGCERFNVKIRLGIDETTGEHVWLDSLFFKEEKFFGVLKNIPERTTRVGYGDILEIAADSLSDWMYVRDSILLGGYTLKVLYDETSEDEKRRMEEKLGAKIK